MKTKNQEIWDSSLVQRGTKCFGAWSRLKDGSHYEGAFPSGFLKWLKLQGWHYGKVIHLCSGKVQDEDSFKVDIRPEVKPDLVADARNTGLPEKSFDVVIIDPPYSAELSKNLYGTEKYFSGIDAFTKEASRIVRDDGLIITLSYQIPKRIKGFHFIAVWGIYTIPSVSYMRCLTVSCKKFKPQNQMISKAEVEKVLNVLLLDGIINNRQLDEEKKRLGI